MSWRDLYLPQSPLNNPFSNPLGGGLYGGSSFNPNNPYSAQSIGFSGGTYGNFAPQSNSLVQNTLTGLSSLLEPFQLPQQVLFAVIEGVASNDWERFKSSLWDVLRPGNLARFAPFGDKPDIVTGNQLLERLGASKEISEQRGWILDLFADPMLVGSVVSGVGILTKSKDLFKAGQAIDKLWAPTTWLQAADKGLTRGGVGRFVESVTQRILDYPLPALTTFRKTTSLSGMAEMDEAVTIGELFKGRYLPRTKQSPELQEFGERYMGSKEFGVGIIDFSRGRANVIQRQLKGAIDFSLEEMYKASSGNEAAFRRMNEIAGELLDNLALKPDANRIGKIKTVVEQNDWSQLESLIKTEIGVSRLPQVQQKYIEHIRNLSKATGLDENAMREAIERSAARTYAATAAVGKYLSGYDDWMDAINDTVNNMQAMGIQISRADAEAHMWFTAMGHQGSPLTTIPPVGQNSKSLADDFEQMYRAQLKRGFKNRQYSMMRFGAFHPATFIRNLEEGYLRRTFLTHLDPESVQKMLSQKTIFVFDRATLDPGQFALEFRHRFGQQAGDAIESFMKGAVTGRIVTSDLLEIVAQHAPKAKLEDVLDTIEFNVLGKLGIDSLAEKTLSKTDATLRGSKEITYSPFRLRRETFKTRQQLDPSEVDALVQLTGLSERAADLGLAGARAARATELLSRTYEDLNDLGLIYRKGTAYRQGLVRKNQAMAKIDGVDYVLLEQASAWGPLAGNYIPKVAAREIASVMSIPAHHRDNAYQQFLGAVRRGFLAPLPTALRNAYGNFALLHTAGIPLGSLSRYVGKAFKELREYAETGRSPIFSQAEDVIHFMHDASLSRSLTSDIEQGFIKVIDEASKSKAPIKKLLDGADEFLRYKVFGNERLGALKAAGEAIYGGGIKEPTKSPILGGFLGMFQFFEDLSRATVYLWALDKQKRTATTTAEAIRKAAWIANNAAYDYSGVGLAVDFIRKTGFGLFPAFGYLTLQRTADNLMRNPVTLLKMEKPVIAANSIFIPDHEERQAVDNMMLDYWAMKYRPIVLKTNEPGVYRLLPTNYLVPHGMLSAGEHENLFWELTSLGAWRPFVDVIHAYTGGPRGDQPGKPTPMSQRFAGEVYAPDQQGNIPAMVAGTAKYLATAYLPGTMRTILPMLMQSLPIANLSESQVRELQESQKRWFNLEPDQWVTKLAGMPTYKAGGTITYQQQMASIRKDEQREIGYLRQQLQLAMLTGNEKMIAELEERLQNAITKFNEQRRIVAIGFEGTQR